MDRDRDRRGAGHPRASACGPSPGYANRAAGGLLVAAGAYIFFFWTVSLSTGTRTTPGPIQGVEVLSARLTNALGSRSLVVATVLVTVLFAAAVYTRVARRSRLANPSSTQSSDRVDAP